MTESPDVVYCRNLCRVLERLSESHPDRAVRSRCKALAELWRDVLRVGLQPPVERPQETRDPATFFSPLPAARGPDPGSFPQYKPRGRSDVLVADDGSEDA